MYSFTKIFITIITLLLVVITVFIFVNKDKAYLLGLVKRGSQSNVNIAFTPPEGIPSTQLEATTNTAVMIPLSLLNTSRAAFFTYPVKQNNKTHLIRFFVVKDVDSYRAVLDACALCYKSNEGYDYKAPLFTCRDCGMEFHWKRVGVSKGNCNPIKIGSLQEGSYLLISREDLEKSVPFFEEKAPK